MTERGLDPQARFAISLMRPVTNAMFDGLSGLLLYSRFALREAAERFLSRAGPPLVGSPPVCRRFRVTWACGKTH